MICNRLKHDDVLRILPQRDPQAHKGSFGKILLLCGSRGFTGAAALAAMGALRSGAGLVYLGVPECIYDIAAVKLTEPVVIPLPDNGKTLSEAAISEIRQLLPKIDAVLIGCGLGQSRDTLAVVTTVLREFDGPVVLDASAIIKGNIKSKSVQIDHGAVIEGMCSQCYADVSPASFFNDYKSDSKKGKDK